MGVVMKGGTSGCRHDYLPSISGSPNMPLLDTATSGAVPSSIRFQAESPGYQAGTPDFMPTGGTIPEGSTDVAEHGVPGSSMGATSDVFKGSPNTGLKGGPA